jgi:iron-sulfur cluster assembly accessory protein
VITLTENAIAKFEEALDPTDYVRVEVTSGGCSGYKYSMVIEEEDEGRENDISATFGNIKVSMDPISAQMLSQTVVDYVETLASEGFKFTNPIASNTCGCGASFSQQEACPSKTGEGAA